MDRRGNRPLKVAIIGAGIGGVAAATALRQRGIEVEIHERATALGEVGAGLQIGPNAFKVLRALGLEEATRRIAFEPIRKTTLNWDDASIRSRIVTKGTFDETYGAPYMTASRADLHRMLRAPLPESVIHLGKTCTGASSEGDGAAAFFADGTTVEADIIIGADGIRSTIGQKLFGAQAPRFTKSIAWRCIIDISHVPTSVGPNGAVDLQHGEYFSWYGPTGQVICYPIGDGSRLNIFAGRISEGWVDESWAIPSSRAELIEAYSGWNPALLRMFEKVEHCYKWGIFDREPRAEWTQGRITLLGDAAHPTMPNLAQGANMAIEDAYVLARCLATAAADPAAALARYVNQRKPRTSLITLQSRENFESTLAIPPRPPLDRGWIFEFDATRDPDEAAGLLDRAG